MDDDPDATATLMPSKVSVRNIVFSWGRDALRSAADKWRRLHAPRIIRVHTPDKISAK